MQNLLQQKFLLRMTALSRREGRPHACRAGQVVKFVERQSLIPPSARLPPSEYVVKRQVDRGGCAALRYNPATTRTRLSGGVSFVLETVMLRRGYRKLEHSAYHSRCVCHRPASYGGTVETCSPPFR